MSGSMYVNGDFRFIGSSIRPIGTVPTERNVEAQLNPGLALVTNPVAELASTVEEPQSRGWPISEVWMDHRTGYLFCDSMAGIAYSSPGLKQGLEWQFFDRLLDGIRGRYPLTYGSNVWAYSKSDQTLKSLDHRIGEWIGNTVVETEVPVSFRFVGKKGTPFYFWDTAMYYYKREDRSWVKVTLPAEFSPKRHRPYKAGCLLWSPEHSILGFMSSDTFEVTKQDLKPLGIHRIFDVYPLGEELFILGIDETGFVSLFTMGAFLAPTAQGVSYINGSDQEGYQGGSLYVNKYGAAIAALTLNDGTGAIYYNTEKFDPDKLLFKSSGEYLLLANPNSARVLLLPVNQVDTVIQYHISSDLDLVYPAYSMETPEWQARVVTDGRQAVPNYQEHTGLEFSGNLPYIKN